MTRSRPLQRRRLLAGLAILAAASPARALARAAPAAPASPGILHGADLGLVPDSSADQSAALQKAVDAAAMRGLPLFLAGGAYRAGNVALRSATTIVGVDGATFILGMGDAPIFHAEGQRAITLRSLALDGSTGGSRDNRSGLIAFGQCDALRLDGLDLHQAPGNALFLDGCAGLVTGSSFGGRADIGIFALNSHDLSITANRVFDCANGGILIWRDESGPDGSIVSGNHITGISAQAGGNGQNGNGINLFRADRVIVADNVIADCDFSAVRANSTNDTAIRGNTCTDCRETAIFSEFAFSGSVISGNIIDRAAAGISITNFDQGGRLAVCSGNIVRNLLPNSPTNPDGDGPYGIAAQADTAVTGNSVTGFAGVGISAGYGPFLRNVLIADNVIADIDTGIEVTVADGAGNARIAGNMISGARLQAIVGMKWQDMASPDLAADAARFPNVTVEGNMVGP
jgi:uncharacterized secreted repeat protein (TIGR03808 family)